MQQAASPERRAVVWAAPRSLSTAFERCVSEIPRGKVFHEPLAAPFFYGPDRISKRYISDEIKPDMSYDVTYSTLSEDRPEHDYLFVKDMAYHVVGRYEEAEARLSTFKQTFLIRDPAKAILSLYKGSTDKGLTGWNYFDESEAGFQEMYDLYTFLVSKGHDPVIIDADDILDEPEGMIKLYCDAIGFKYQPGMTSWEAGPRPDWSIWSGWHTEAINSTGFKKRQPGMSKKPAETLPEEVQVIVDKVRPLYEKMHLKRLTLGTKEQ